MPYSEGTRKFIALIVGLCFMTLIAFTAVGMIRATEQDNQARIACIEAGGVWSTACSWSQAPSLVVEEDGSIEGYGCLVGRPCDDREG